MINSPATIRTVPTANCASPLSACSLLRTPLSVNNDNVEPQGRGAPNRFASRHKKHSARNSNIVRLTPEEQRQAENKGKEIAIVEKEKLLLIHLPKFDWKSEDYDARITAENR